MAALNFVDFSVFTSQSTSWHKVVLHKQDRFKFFLVRFYRNSKRYNRNELFVRKIGHLEANRMLYVI